MKSKKAILLVSFGTTHKDTREKTISAIRKDIEDTFVDFLIYEAWTSGMIRNIVNKNQETKIFSVLEAMQQMKLHGIEEIYIQPTHVINGIENDQMIKDASTFKEDFKILKFGNPLLTTREDFKEVCSILKNEFAKIPKDEAVVLMGHGTTHYANSAYAALDYECKDEGLSNYFIGTVEGYPDIEAVFRQVDRLKPKKVHLAPFMIVAGDHAKNDLAGENKDSWNRLFLEKGYKTSIILKGLGEYEAIRALFIKHIQTILDLQSE